MIEHSSYPAMPDDTPTPLDHGAKLTCDRCGESWRGPLPYLPMEVEPFLVWLKRDGRCPLCNSRDTTIGFPKEATR